MVTGSTPVEMSVSSTLAEISLVGFAIQQTLQILDPFIEMIAKKTIWKKAIMGSGAFVLGLVVVYGCDLDLLRFVGVAHNTFISIVSAVVFSAGTEGANTVQKYFGYVKEAKAAFQVAVSILPSTLSLRVGNSAQFIAAVTGGNAEVEWSVADSTLGAVTQTGLFTASAEGTCYVFARNKANPAIGVLPASVREIAVAQGVACHPKWRMAHATKRQVRDPGGDGEGEARYRGMAVDAHEALSAA